MSTKEQYKDLSVIEKQECICGWPTDTVNIDFNIDDNSEHPYPTLILFTPGNPGVVQWYISFLCKVLQQLGNGFAVRACSLAGHGLDDNVVGTDDDHIMQSFDREHINNKSSEVTKDGQRNFAIPWTMKGQIIHRTEWIDNILKDWKIKHPTSPLPKLVFINHSIGAHFIQTMLIQRPDILKRTQQCILITPFIRFDPPLLTKLFLSRTAQAYRYTIPTITSIVKVLSAILPRKLIDIYLNKVMRLNCDNGRRIALDVFMNDKMVRNHLVLGFEEIRELCEHPNGVALRILGFETPLSILFCGKDQWAPESHLRDLQYMQSQSQIPNIQMDYTTKIQHDFIVHPEQIDPVVEYCVGKIKTSNPSNIKRNSVGEESSSINLRSRL